jgi:hypothetical protein
MPLAGLDPVAAAVRGPPGAAPGDRVRAAGWPGPGLALLATKWKQRPGSGEKAST